MPWTEIIKKTVRTFCYYFSSSQWEDSWCWFPQEEKYASIKYMSSNQNLKEDEAI